MSVSTSAADRGCLWRSRFLRAALALPLLYVLHDLVDRLFSHWNWAFPAAQSGRFYLVTGLLWVIPIATWGLALGLLLIGVANRPLWAAVCVGGLAIAAYGALLEFDLSLGLMNPLMVFGLYAGLLGLWQLLWRRGRRAGPESS